MQGLNNHFEEQHYCFAHPNPLFLIILVSCRLLKGPQPYLVMYSSDYDLQTGETWCPDCRRAVPGVLSALKENGVGSLLLVQVSRSTGHHAKFLGVTAPRAATTPPKPSFLCQIRAKRVPICSSVNSAPSAYSTQREIDCQRVARSG